MASVDELLFRLSNFYDLFPDGDRTFIRTLWIGYAEAVSDLYLQLFQYDQAKSIDTVPPLIRRLWVEVNLSFTKALAPSSYALNQDIVRIPELQTLILTPGTVVISGTDYTIANGAITFTSALGRAVSGKILRLVDESGNPLPAKAVADTNLTGLVSGVDYDWPGGTDPIVVHSPAAFARFTATNDPEILHIFTAHRLWAPNVFADEDLVFRNFGFYLNLPRKETGFDVETYARVIRGLWFVVWNGPTPRNIRSGLSLIFNYPTAADPATVARIETRSAFDLATNTFSPKDTAILTLADQREISVEIPQPFRASVRPGDLVARFEALSDAVFVFDEVNNEGWWRTNLGLARYIVSGSGFSAKSPAEQAQLKALLRHFNAGIRLKAFEFTQDLLERARLARVATSFLELIRPVYAQFAFLGQDATTGPIVDGFTMGDTGFEAGFGGQGLFARIMHQTVGDNVRNQLIPPDEVRPPAPFTTLAAYEAAVPGVRPYNLGSDVLILKEDLTVTVTTVPAPPPIVDTSIPKINHTPEDGLYPEPFQSFVAAQDLAELILTIDGSQPVFSNPTAIPTAILQNGVRVFGPIIIPRGTKTVNALARSKAGVTNRKVIDYVVPRKLAPVTTFPSPTAAGSKLRISASIIFATADPTATVYYSTDGKAPADVSFSNAKLLNGLKLERVGSNAMTVSDPGIPIDFPSGRSIINRELQTPKVILPRAFGRYFGYAQKLEDGSWVLDFKHFNTIRTPDNENLLLIGFAIASEAGQFVEASVINAADAGSVLKVINDLTFSRNSLAGALGEGFFANNSMNRGNPVVIPSTAPVTLRFFSVRSARQDMFELPQTLLYEFDTTPPKTKIKSAVTNTPFTTTLIVTLETDTPGGQIFFSTTSLAPEDVLFGFPEKLTFVHPLTAQITTLTVNQAGVNQVRPSTGTLSIQFRRNVAGQITTLNTIGNIDAGKPTAASLSNPGGVDFLRGVSRKLAIADQDNHRVLIWNDYFVTFFPGANGPLADIVIGQPDFLTGSRRLASSTALGKPRDVAFSPTSAHIAVADAENHRVLIWNTVPTTNNAPASVVLGQANFSGALPNRGTPPTATSAAANTLDTPMGVLFFGLKLFVADTGNNRVLIWNTIPTVNGQAADVVLGQVDFTARAANQSLTPNAGTLFGPRAITGGNRTQGSYIAVSDSGNNRVLLWNGIPTTSGTNADQVIGQATFTFAAANRGSFLPTSRSLHSPEGLRAWELDRLLIVDAGNQRVIQFFVGTTGDAASLDAGCFGQANFTTLRDTTRPSDGKTLLDPIGVFAIRGDEAGLGAGAVNNIHTVITSSREHRALAYGPISISFYIPVQPTANKVLGQPTLTDVAPNRGSSLIDIPSSPVGAFYDITVVPDANQTDRWRLELAQANIPAVEASDRFLVARVRTNSQGILDVFTDKGFIMGGAFSAATRNSRKFVEPLVFDASSGDFELTIAFFAVDQAGNAETAQVVTLRPHAV